MRFLIAITMICGFWSLSAHAEKPITIEVFASGKQVPQLLLPLLQVREARPTAFELQIHVYEFGFTTRAAEVNLDTQYILDNHPDKLSAWLNCWSQDPEAWSCRALSGADFAKFNRQRSALTEKLTKNAVIARERLQTGFNFGGVFIDGRRYEKTLFLSALILELNKILPADQKFKNVQAYAPATLHVIATPSGLGSSDGSIEREVLNWVPNVTIETHAPESSTARKILKAVNRKDLPLYAFTPDSRKNYIVHRILATNGFEGSTKSADYLVYRHAGTKVNFIAENKEVPNELTLWVMSQCPFGVKAENSFIESMRRGYGKDLKLKVRYILNEDKTGKEKWASLHGQPEVQENIRQATIQKIWPDKFLAYLEARNKDYESEDWASAAKIAGLDPEQVSKNLKAGEKQMALDAKESRKLEISGSPTFVLNNRYLFKTSDFVQLKTALGFDPYSVGDTTKQ